MGKAYTIKETTRVQREKIALEALGISTLDAAEPTAETAQLVGEYIKGKIEIDEVLKKTIEKYNVRN